MVAAVERAVENIGKCDDPAAPEGIVSRMTAQAVQSRMLKRHDEMSFRLIAAIAETRLADLRAGSAACRVSFRAELSSQLCHRSRST
jgi:hypothetical protein